MSVSIRRPKVDLDQEKLKGQAAELGAAALGAYGLAKVGAGVAAGKAAGYAAEAKDYATPRVEHFIEWLAPRIETLYTESLKAAAPRVEKAAEIATPAIGSAHDKLVEDLLPKLVAALNEAAEKAGAAAEKAVDAAAGSAESRIAAVGAAAHAVTAPPAKHTGAKVFWITSAVVGAGAAAFAYARSRSAGDPWAEPWEPDAPRTSAAGTAGGAAAAVGEAAGATLAKGRQAVGKVAEVSEELGERVQEARKDLAEKVAEVAGSTKDAARRTRKGAAADASDEPAADTTGDLGLVGVTEPLVSEPVQVSEPVVVDEPTVTAVDPLTDPLADPLPPTGDERKDV